MIIETHAPKNTIRQINAIWAVISVDDGGEGVCAVIMDGISYPLIAADEERLAWIIEQAELFARFKKKTIKLIKLSERTELRTIEGRGDA